MPIPCHSVLHGLEGSAWARSLGVPLSDLRLLCGSIDGWGGVRCFYRGGIWESRGTFTQIVYLNCQQNHAYEEEEADELFRTGRSFDCGILEGVLRA